MLIFLVVYFNWPGCGLGIGIVKTPSQVILAALPQLSLQGPILWGQSRGGSLANKELIFLNQLFFFSLRGRNGIFSLPSPSWGKDGTAINQWGHVSSCVLSLLWHLHHLGPHVCHLLIRRKACSLSQVLCQLFYQTELSLFSEMPLLRWERAIGAITNLQKLRQWPYSLLKWRGPGQKICLVAYLLQWKQMYLQFLFLCLK